MKHVADAFIRAAQLQNSALVLHRSERTEKFANARTVHISHVAKIEQQVLVTLLEKVANQLVRRYIILDARGNRFTKPDFSTQIDDVTPLACRTLHAMLMGNLLSGINRQSPAAVSFRNTAYRYILQALGKLAPAH